MPHGLLNPEISEEFITFPEVVYSAIVPGADILATSNCPRTEGTISVPSNTTNELPRIARTRLHEMPRIIIFSVSLSHFKSLRLSKIGSDKTLIEFCCLTEHHTRKKAVCRDNFS